jgi:hypothetical protein
VHTTEKEGHMRFGGTVGAVALALSLGAAATPSAAFDESRYPDLSGQWRRLPVPGVTGQPGYDPTKIQGRAQQAPLTPAARAILEASIADQAKGGQGNDPTFNCLSPGMPRIMTIYDPMEIIVTPAVTHMLIGHVHDSRRIYTDGRPWPDEIDPSYAGYSIGRWIDTDGDGRYDTLEVETRGFKGPRVFDAAGIPLDADNRTIIKERIFTDRTNPDVLYDEITTIDHALTRPWTVLKRIGRVKVTQPSWNEAVCAEGNNHVGIAGETYFMSGDGYLMPTRKGQAPPDLRYFKKPRP